jgi:hypothetical protein
MSGRASICTYGYDEYILEKNEISDSFNQLITELREEKTVDIQASCHSSYKNFISNEIF